MKCILPRTVLALCLSLAAATGQAREEPAGVQPRGVSVGPALIVGQPIYRGTGHADRLVVPFLGYESARLYLRGLRAGYRAWQPGRFAVDIIAQPRLDQLDPDDSDALTGMALRRRTLEAGLVGSWRTGAWGLSATALTDTLNRHQGQALELDLGYRIGPPFAFLRPSLSATWQSADLANYYYGVREDEQRPDRPAYSPGATLDLALGVAGRYGFTRRWGAFVLARHAWLDEAIADSPIVARDRRWSTVVALSYTFR